MGFIKNKGKMGSQEERSSTAPFRKSLRDSIRNQQQKAAIYLSDRTARLSGVRIKTLLILFCLSSGGLSLYFTGNGFASPDKRGSAIGIQKISVPKYYQRTGEEKLQAAKSLALQKRFQLQSVKRYTDSLISIEKARHEFDSLRSRHSLFERVKKPVNQLKQN